jgi:diguanylate cyclase (GGDEF)-like protein
MADELTDRLVAALEELAAAVGADAGAALYLDDGDGVLLPAAATGEAAARPARLIERLVGGAHRGRPASGASMTLTLPGTRGFLVLNRRSNDSFTQQDRTLAQLYARRLSADGSAAATQLSRSGWARQLEAIQRIAARLTRLASVDEVGAAICIETAEVIDHDEAHVLVVDGGGVPRLVAASRTAGQVPPPLPMRGQAANALARAFRGGVPVLAGVVTDLGPDRPGTHSLLVVPLQYEHRVTGLICLMAEGSNRFDDDDQRLLRILSDQAAVAIENSSLLRGRDQLVQELAGLLEISEAAGGAADERQLADLLATRLRGLTGTDGALVALWEEGSTELRVVSHDGVTRPQGMLDVADSPARRAVLREGRVHVVQAAATAGHEADQLRRAGGHTLVLLPLNAGGRPIGIAEVVALASPYHPTDAEMQACEAMAGLAATGLERVRVAEQLRNAADVDLVTGVHNHRYLQERLRQEVARSARSHSPLAVLMMDLDKFKPINDRHGHADGDRVLHNIGATIKSQLRANDVVARYGGDEFVVLMPDTGADQAEQGARRIVAAVLRARHMLSDGSSVGVGVSAGLSVYPADGRTSTELLSAADAAMYNAKRGGGQQIERSSSRLFADMAPTPAAIAG